ncbi:MAG TPA: AAA family ATPase [Candidatus Dormibacteraeota bacterium]|jgi:stage III sporulation protein SpoIIIAA|nr:AAA family ATPase [Candidatus Dormibacteraeota bacterium]
MPGGTRQDWAAELDLLLATLPPGIRDAARALTPGDQELIEIVMDLGRMPEARHSASEALLSRDPVTNEDLDYVAARIGRFGDDNRAGIGHTLHRISAIRNRQGEIVGLTCRVGRAVTGTIDLIKDLVVSGRSILLLGRPGVGKTTMLRECARVLADERRKRVVIVDTSNEIGGDGDIPHPGIGRARRMQVQTPNLQHAVMIEAVENHMPEVIVIDEIGTELEAMAARTIAERGVQLVATAHGRSLDNLLVNPTLNDLLGGIQTVTLGDEEARRRGTQKSVQERKAPPTFDVLVEIQERDQLVVHTPLDEVVDLALRGAFKPPQLRTKGADGKVVTRVVDAPARLPERRGRDGLPAPRTPRRPGEVAYPPRLVADRAASGVTRGRAAYEPMSIFPYGVSRSHVEQSIKELGVPVRILHHPEDADLVMTLKNYYRRRDSPIQHAEARGTPVEVLRSNTATQVRNSLARLYNLEEKLAEGEED